MTQNNNYTFATGEAGTYRLQILHNIHRSFTESWLREAGLEAGMHVADIGCGIGGVTNWMAEQVGSTGSVIGVDLSIEQIEQARKSAASVNLKNLSFIKGSADKTGLSRNSLDLVYCRFLLMHLVHPMDALQEMKSILKPGGVLVCEEADFSQAFCDPPSPHHDRCFKLLCALGDQRQQHFWLGATLHQLIWDLGMRDLEVSHVQPVSLRGKTKLLMPLCLVEAKTALIEAGISTSEEIEQTISALKRLAENEKVLFGIPKVTQIWARK
jgi:ubiquinone/menaquinone biosynthesis C-methylase UbiE